MRGDEKTLWVVLHWMFSLMTMWWLVWSAVTDWDRSVSTSPMILFPITLGIIFVWWLFRVTYLKGKGSRYK